MSTLFSQPDRLRCEINADILESFITEAVTLAKKYRISVTDVIAAKHALEIQRSNDLFVNNGDTFDEQMTGFAELLEEHFDYLQGKD